MNYKELKDFVKKHCHYYYDLSAPKISDSEFDKYYDKLKQQEDNQGWADPDSPTINVGGYAGKISHPFRLYSLRKVYDKNEIEDWMDVVTPKIDGTNITLVYKNGKLKLALTRGNGERGDNVTYLAKNIKNIPITIDTVFDYLVINGECVTDNEVSNFRNYVSGAFSLKSEAEFREKNILFIAHDFLNSDLDYIPRMKYISSIGFTTVFSSNVDKYPHDGVVYRCNSYTKSKNLGYTSKYPRFAVALKPRLIETVSTILQDVYWSVGRTGTVNPTGIIDPVVLDGATISRVTLHNIEQIEKHNLGLGDKIEIERAGGVIPKFIRVLEHSAHNLKITKQHAEQAIKQKVKREGPRLLIIEGKGNSEKELEHFISTLKIKGLGPASIKKLDLLHISDLFNNNLNWDVLGANGIKIQDEMEKLKYRPYHQVLAALGIPGVGLSAAKLIVKHIPEFRNLKDINFLDIKGIGPVTKEKIISWLEENEGWVSNLPLNLEEHIDNEEITNERKVCITGKLDMTRNELSDHLTNLNFKVTTTVTKDCYALICGDETTGSKYKKAETLGIKIVNYWKNKKEVLNGEF